MSTSKDTITNNIALKAIQDAVYSSAEQKQNATMAAKELTETGLFSFFATAENFLWFSTHVLRFIFFPIIGITFLLNGILESYKLYKAKNKNADSIGNLIASYLVGGLAIASVTGTILAGAGVLAAEFALGPFLFIGALSVGFLHQLGMSIVNLARFFNAPKGSEERQAFKQAIFRNAFQMVLLATIALTVTAVMVSPMGPAVMAGLAITAAALTGLNLIWRIMPKKYKNGIKSFFGFGKPSLEVTLNNAPSLGPQDALTDTDRSEATSSLIQAAPKHNKGLFTASYRNHKVIKILNHQGIDAAKKYLLNEIDVKEQVLSGKTIEASSATSLDQKTTSKLAVLAHLRTVINDPKTSLQTTSHLAKEHKRAFQSFFAHVSDTEDLHKAVNTYVETRNLAEPSVEKAANMN